MSLIEVEQEKCKRDGICATICPLELILQEGEGFPEPTGDADELCISCGHCVAVCPTGALSLSGLPVRDCLPMQDDLRVSAEAVEQFLKVRRSVRVFKEEPVAREVLERVIDSTRWAPSAINIQPVRWLVIERPVDVRTLAGLIAEWMRKETLAPRYIAAWDRGKDVVLRGAPHLVAACGPTENFWGPVDCAIAVTYLELAAQAHGLGTCWSGLLTRAATSYAPIAEFLGLKEDQRINGALMIGYPKYRYRRIPMRNRAMVTWR
ncbi:MAG: nitroreductase [Deltaproteobacteria bacterium]|nr:nitroreductase [Deltaproteobacteria bacterium]